MRILTKAQVFLDLLSAKKSYVSSPVGIDAHELVSLNIGHISGATPMYFELHTSFLCVR
jgi:hypothetical protein